MYKCTAKGCKATFNRRIGLGVHRVTCRHRFAEFKDALFSEPGSSSESEDDQRSLKRRKHDEGVNVAPECLPSPSPPPPAAAMQTRSGRTIRIPKRFVDFVPSNTEELAPHVSATLPEAPHLSSPLPYRSPTVEDAVEVEDIWELEPDVFGLYRTYTAPVQRDPEASRRATNQRPGCEPIADNDPRFANISWLSQNSTLGVGSDLDSSSLGPFPNCSQFRLIDWWHNASLTKSQEDFNSLLDLLHSKGFSIDDLQGLEAQQAQRLLDDFASPTGIFSTRDGWQQGTVNVPLPKTKVSYPSEQDAPTAAVPGLFFRRIIEVLRGVATDARFADEYHWVPHSLKWQPPVCAEGDDQPVQPNAPPSGDGDERSRPSPTPPDPVQVFTDLFNTEAMQREFEAIRRRPREPTDAADLEYGILPLMLWSDATHLTSFGSASLWPIYLYIGALSKYIRGMPTEFAAHHIAYIPSLPDTIQELYTQHYGTTPSADVLTFCKRELMQRIWLMLLDEDFMEAYKHGILIDCADGIKRRLFPRILTYSADYPENEASESGTPAGMLRASEKRIDNDQLHRDIQKARDLVFKKGYSLASTRVQALLDARSLNPIQTAFSTRLAPFGVNFYNMFVPDLMHEFELGVWKGTFAHLLRLLEAQGDDVVTEFNHRMRSLPTFGRDTIRKFWDNVSAQRKLAARDYEDFLQVMMPVFEGLLPLKDDETIADLLFELANWHALAKLRLHTEVTLDIFRVATTELYAAMRAFAATTCTRYETHELEREAEARVRREEKRHGAPPPNRRRKIVQFSTMKTYKYHSLQHYPDAIPEFGTLDGYNSQVAELEHRHAKRYYARTNKIEYTGQIASHQRRESLLRAIRIKDGYIPRHERLRAQREAARKHPRAQPSGPAYDEREDDLPPISPLSHYSISQSSRLPLYLGNWLAENDEDPATENFIPQLQAHLLARICGDVEDPTLAQLDGVEIHNDRIYRHKILRLNYTAYNLRREQDTINPRTHADIMTLAPSGDVDHPFWYGRVIDIFHTQARYTGPGATPAMTQWRRVEFLRIRWFEHDPEYLCGFTERRLPRLRFVHDDDPLSCAFSFIDPADVIRAAYIIPAFAHGTTTSLLRPSELARPPEDKDTDFKYYYVCIFADRDVYMRHLGGGVGHCGAGIDVEASRGNAFRATPPGYPSDDSPSLSTGLAEADADECDVHSESDDGWDEPDVREDGWWWDGGCDQDLDEFFARDNAVFAEHEGDEFDMDRDLDEENQQAADDVYEVEGFAPL
ncbi:hypothetical protein BN946_scf184657.g29 [Trametes cinnabarina]|uniref:C2H2-type domain-containing protein n=1 Tax=Pycnoporus cinnabarinus TaxID=5643 RepID=A0A060SY31_PYCCI|nr:hypothetical protein BN946_scf184657.g29 [Trametes cinnabarina]